MRAGVRMCQRSGSASANPIPHATPARRSVAVRSGASGAGHRQQTVPADRGEQEHAAHRVVPGARADHHAGGHRPGPPAPLRPMPEHQGREVERHPLHARHRGERVGQPPVAAQSCHADCEQTRGATPPDGADQEIEEHRIEHVEPVDARWVEVHERAPEQARQSGEQQRIARRVPPRVADQRGVGPWPPGQDVLRVGHIAEGVVGDRGHAPRDGRGGQGPRQHEGGDDRGVTAPSHASAQRDGGLGRAAAPWSARRRARSSLHFGRCT